MVKVEYRGKVTEVKPDMSARDAILKLGLDPESVLVIRNGTLVTDDTLLKEGDNVRLVAVISGGV